MKIKKMKIIKYFRKGNVGSRIYHFLCNLIQCTFLHFFPTQIFVIFRNMAYFSKKPKMKFQKCQK